MNWMWFYVAAVLAFLALVLNGAPALPVLAGIGVVGLLNWRKAKSKGRLAAR